MSSSNPSTSTSSPRRTHRKRISALRLSSDTTASLPQYIPASRYPHPVREEHDPFDQPPDYPDSAEEADEDTDTDTANVFYVPHLPPASPLIRPQTASPRRAKRFQPTHKRRQSFQAALHGELPEPADPHLDALLARSVHALEMSNTLLQSSMATQTSLSTILAADSPADSALEARARGLSSRIRDTWDARTTWADDLEELTRDVEGLFNDDDPDAGARSRRPGVRARHQLEGSGASGVSASLPSSSSMHALSGSARRPSLLDLREPLSAEAVPRLHYSQQNRANLIAPPPRAMTQYMASTHEADSILLPSTMGVRSPPSLHASPDFRPTSEFASSSTTSLLSSASMTSLLLPPKLTDRQLEPATPAYNMLASFVYRAPSSGSATPSSSFTHSFMARRRGSSTASNSTERGNNKKRRTSPSPSSHQARDMTHRQDRYSAFKNAGPPSAATLPSRSGVSPFDIRPMTPPVEESSSSSDGCVAKRTVQSLRKILDDQPALPPKLTPGQALRPPAFLPRTAPPAPQASTSTATASISRLFTKGTHSSSTRPPEPPRQSAMKRAGAARPPSPSASTSSASHTPTPTPSTLSIPELVGRVLGAGSGGSSAPSSGQSTPSKRISFAELPESYASTRPPSARFADKAARQRRRAGEKGRQRQAAEEPELGGWWGGWLGGAAAAGGGVGPGAALARHEEKMEDRMTRSWGGRMSSGFGGGLDEWAV
ncbi:hypothetical protein HYPSUDRAFT_196103 [Hypholoma sublateritium FD-334 SS-4]|uniref:Uncharacterized protein n=1 Tax=Hypholoma sublateritium (strain FD-334 SS-4) TaxID=945553 RepID=A0A0D2LNY1_HYPSF|nr:hypothetical protein HYPSUDRAFT_196103 [Hypholoma sublateritium FD-334 SS-4]